MLKKIAIEDLVPDMFVAEINAGEGTKLPKKKAGMVRDPRIIAKFVEIGVVSVVIDTDRGRDIVDELKSDAQEPADLEEAEEPETPEVDPAESPVNEALAAVLGELIEESSMEYRPLELEWKTATDIFTTSSALINASLHRVKNKGKIHVEYFAQAANAISKSLMRNPDALTWLGKIRTEKQYSYEHASNSAFLMGIFCNASGFSPQQTEEAVTGALLHDVGEALIDENVYYKNGPLTDDELQQMREHVQHAERVIEGFDDLPQITKFIIKEHHERCDGSGYPKGLEKEQISLYGRMFAIVDSFDAMTTNKTYKKAQPSSISMKELLTTSKGQYDEQLLHKFIKCMGIYPTGSLVKLNNGLLAVVIAQHPESPLKPLVKAVFNSKSNQYINPFMIDLERPPTGEKILSYEDPRDFKIDVIEFMPEEMQWA